MKNIMEIISRIKNHKLFIARAAVIKDVILVIGKIIFSIFTMSYFMFANALYSACMGIGRLIAIKMHKQNNEEQLLSYQCVGIIILIASVCYVIYSARQFFGERSVSYPMTVALVIALYTFVEFGINVREAFRLRKSRALEAKALSALSFSSTLLCFVLTQTAIMSFAGEGDNNFYNALSGVIFGSIATLVGVNVILQSFVYKRHEAEIKN